jgi:ABC-2 type transport system permease protein
MMVFILMGGLFTPIESMPEWAQEFTLVNPLSYLIEVLRMIVLKGSTFLDVMPYFLMVAVFAVVLNAWAMLNYKKTS